MLDNIQISFVEAGNPNNGSEENLTSLNLANSTLRISLTPAIAGKIAVALAQLQQNPQEIFAVSIEEKGIDFTLQLDLI